VQRRSDNSIPVADGGKEKGNIGDAGDDGHAWQYNSRLADPGPKSTERRSGKRQRDEPFKCKATFDTAMANSGL
jgi:hypothetical protein